MFWQWLRSLYLCDGIHGASQMQGTFQIVSMARACRDCGSACSVRVDVIAKPLYSWRLFPGTEAVPMGLKSCCRWQLQNYSWRLKHPDLSPLWETGPCGVSRDTSAGYHHKVPGESLVSHCSPGWERQPGNGSMSQPVHLAVPGDRWWQTASPKFTCLF